MPFPSLGFLEQLSEPLTTILKKYSAALNTWLQLNHKDDGTHGAVVADSVTISGALTTVTATVTGVTNVSTLNISGVTTMTPPAGSPALIMTLGTGSAAIPFTTLSDVSLGQDLFRHSVYFGAGSQQVLSVQLQPGNIGGVTWTASNNTATGGKFVWKDAAGNIVIQTSGTVTTINSLVINTAVSTFGNSLTYDGSNVLKIGIPGTTNAKKASFVDSGGNVVASIDGVGDGAFIGSILSSSASAGVGYSTGAGGTVTQITSKTTSVTLNKVTGQITTDAAALAGGVSVSFVVNNNTVAATDVVVACVANTGGATAYAYTAVAQGVASGSFAITLTNITGGSLSEAVVIAFAVIKGVTS